MTDLDQARTAEATRALGALAVEPEAIYAQAADVFAPCALGAVLKATGPLRSLAPGSCAAAPTTSSPRRAMPPRSPRVAFCSCRTTSPMLAA